MMESPVVVLPQPDSPTMPTHSPCSTGTRRRRPPPRSTCRMRNSVRRLSTSSTGVMATNYPPARRPEPRPGQRGFSRLAGQPSPRAEPLDVGPAPAMDGRQPVAPQRHLVHRRRIALVPLECIGREVLRLARIRRSRTTLASTEAAATEAQRASPPTTGCTVTRRTPTPSRRPDRATGPAGRRPGGHRVARSSRPGPAAAASRRAIRIPHWSHSSGVAWPTAQSTHHAPTDSKIYSRRASLSCLESRSHRGMERSAVRPRPRPPRRSPGRPRRRGRPRPGRPPTRGPRRAGPAPWRDRA